LGAVAEATVACVKSGSKAIKVEGGKIILDIKVDTWVKVNSESYAEGTVKWFKLVKTDS
jgi:hypothetical protein